MDNEIRILVAEDHNLVRKGIIKLIHEEKNIFVIGEATNGKELITLYDKLLPDIVLSDISMPGGISGFEAVELIIKNHPDARILFLSMYNNPDFIYQAKKIGASGLLNKNVLEGELILAIHKITKGEKYFGTHWSKSTIAELDEQYKSQPEIGFMDVPTDFNYRELQVIVGLGKGLSTDEIAEALDLSKSSIDVYRSALIKKLNFKSVNALVAFCVRYILSHSVNEKIEEQYEE